LTLSRSNSTPSCWGPPSAAKFRRQTIRDRLQRVDVIFSIAYPDSDNELRPVQTFRSCWVTTAAVVSAVGALVVRSGIHEGLHGESNALGFGIGIQDLDLDDLARLDGLGRIFDVTVGELADVDQAVLMKADVDEGPKLSDVGDYSFEDHARLDVSEFTDGVGEIGGDEPVAWVTAGDLGLSTIKLSRRRGHLIVVVDAAMRLYFGVQSTVGGAACVRVIPSDGAASKSNRSSSGLAD
jgi:hypothetical protein